MRASNCKVATLFGCFSMSVAITAMYFITARPEPRVPVASVSDLHDTVMDKTEDFAVEERVLGYSETGRPINAYMVGSGEVCLLFFGGIHGNETGTVELLRVFVEHLRTESTLVSASKKLMIVPLLNPDGYFERQDKLNANGVNINRNFETSDWTQYQDGGTFAGETPFSENESLLIKKAVEDCRPVAMLAFHSQGALISPESNRSSIELARWYAEKTGYVYFDEWNYAGTATRWFVETTGYSAITVELPTRDQSDWETQRAALLEFISDQVLRN